MINNRFFKIIIKELKRKHMKINSNMKNHLILNHFLKITLKKLIEIVCKIIKKIIMSEKYFTI